MISSPVPIEISKSGCDTRAVAAILQGATFKDALLHFGLRTEDRDTWNEDAPGVQHEHHYRTDFFWRRAKMDTKNRGMRIVISSGCACAHDCCGCYCGGELVLVSLAPGVISALLTSQFNY